MKKSLTIISAIALSVLIVFLITMSIYTGLNNDRSNPDSASSSEVVYIIKSHEEKIAVFELGKDSPLYVYDFYISSLPEIDAKRINDGIVAYTKTELQQILEDYIT